MEATRTEVLIVDDHLAVRRGTELLLADEGFAVAAGSAAEDDDSRREQLLGGRYDVAMLEIHLHRGRALTLARELLRERPRAPVVLYTAYTGPSLGLMAASQLGAPGLVLTSSPPATLIAALHAVAGGGTFRDPELAGLLAGGSVTERLAALSPRERQVLSLLAEGYSGPEIAGQLLLSLQTVRTHVRNATRKLRVRTRVQAAALVARSEDAPVAN